jgi:hypothetical protein
MQWTLTFTWERLSENRKERFQKIQSDKLQDSENDKQNGGIKRLILDMPVRWSLTYGMLHRAVTLQEVNRGAVFFQ